MTDETKHWSIKAALEQIAKCGFECEAGPLANNAGWQWLIAASKVGPEFMPGQGVYFEICAEVSGHRLSKWAHYFIVGCRMESSTDDRYWVYDLSDDPPSPYHYGEVKFKSVRAAELRLEKP
jgi:hypothetical protein